MKGLILNKISISKNIFVTISIFLGFTLLTTCAAQSIVGKWKGVSVKNYYSADFSKKVGKTMEEKTAKEAGNSEITFNTDHTFIMNMSAPNSTNVMTMKGVWAVTQNKLMLTLEPQYNPQKKTTTAIYTISGNTMETTAVMDPPSRIIKTIAVSIKI
jgi:Lipocalin-like domain